MRMFDRRRDLETRSWSSGRAESFLLIDQWGYGESKAWGMGRPNSAMLKFYLAGSWTRGTSGSIRRAWNPAPAARAILDAVENTPSITRSR